MTHTRIKICGIADIDGLDAAIAAGVDALGFVFAPSPRQVSPRRAAELARSVPPSILKVAVFAHADNEEVRRALHEFAADRVQCEPSARLHLDDMLLPVFHDDEDVFELVQEHSSSDDLVLLEAAGRGGRGVKPDWERAAYIARERRLILAGGLDPANVGAAIAQVRPYGVDVSSGVELSHDVKDPALIRAFVRAVRCADERKHAAALRENVT